jgi:hypothetical protein
MSCTASATSAKRSFHLRTSLVVVLALALFNASADASLLVGSTVYTNAVASSEYSSASNNVARLFDNDLGTDWAINGTRWPSGFAGTNPQGREEGWVSFTFDQVYTLGSVEYAPRQASGTMDGTDTLKIWISSTPFGVDVTNATQTTNFLTSTTGLNPTKTISSFANSSLQSYSFGSPVTGQYVLLQFLNTTDTGQFRNIGGRDLLFSTPAGGTVPEPSSLTVLCVLALASLAMRSSRIQ